MRSLLRNTLVPTIVLATMLAMPASASALSCLAPEEPTPFEEFQRYLRDDPDEARHATLVIGIVGPADDSTYPVRLEAVLEPGTGEFSVPPKADGDGDLPRTYVQTDPTWGPNLAPGRWALVLGHDPTDALVAQLCAPHAQVSHEQARELIDVAGDIAVVYRTPGDDAPAEPEQSSWLMRLLSWLLT